MKEQYEILSKLGDGGFSQVYLARHKLTGRRVVLKVIPETCKEIALREGAFLAAQLSDALPCLYDLFYEDGQYDLVMEYIEGRSLRELIRQGLSVMQTYDIALQIAAFLRDLHSHSPAILYLDLKPENICVESTGRVRMLDMGAAIFMHTGKERFFAGTGAYAPMEQKLGGSPVPAWDIYSFGVVFYEMLTGALPDRKDLLKGEAGFLTGKDIPREYTDLLWECFTGKLDGASLYSLLEAGTLSSAVRVHGFSILRSVRCCEMEEKRL